MGRVPHGQTALDEIVERGFGDQSMNFFHARRRVQRPRTITTAARSGTKLCDRTGDAISLDGVERITV